MTEWPVSCFKAYDIRGLSGDELSDEFAYRLGRALATYLECNSFAVGRDIRESSPGYASNLIQGLVDSGVQVLDLGIVSTGCVYHACWTLPVEGVSWLLHLTCRCQPTTDSKCAEEHYRLLEKRFRN